MKQFTNEIMEFGDLILVRHDLSMISTILIESLENSGLNMPQILQETEGLNTDRLWEKAIECGTLDVRKSKLLVTYLDSLSVDIRSMYNHLDFEDVKLEEKL